ncbi:MAG: AhpC/TSA family protein [Prevotella sp.]|nr:AhpC/TSA family protein [Prevotella sp.]
MSTKNILGTICLGAAAVAFTACNNKTFTVEGTIANAADSILYLENVALDGIQTIDSVKLSAEGGFAFKEEGQDAPEFYRLRIHDQIINISIDSTETVTVTSQYPNMANSYKVEGSEQCKIIQELAYKQIALQQQAFAIQNSPDISYQNGADSINSLIAKYREDIKSNYIYKHPDYSSSYFALFQAVGSQLVFDPRSSEENVKVFAAVATSWDSKYPESERGQNLHNITIENMKDIRYVKAKAANAANTLAKAEASNLIDITLTDNRGKQQSLTSLKGKVVMLDFHVFSGENSTKRIMLMRELYNKYHAQGFEIYQISLDADQHFWKTKTDALPWINVNDPDGIESRNLLLYNVQSIPTFFLINKNNELVKRDAMIKNIDAEIKALL